MGFFNWIFKGVHVENRVPKTNAKEAIVELQQNSDALVGQDDKMPSNPVDNTVNENLLKTGTSPDNSSVSSFATDSGAASILFERVENQPNNFNYNYNNQYTQQQNQFSSALNGSTYGNRNILVVTPRTNAEVTEVVANLQHGDACIICLDGLPTVDAQRRLDFLSGVICAMNGSIKRLNANTYILTPSGIGVRN